MKLCREIYDASVLIDASPSRYYRPDITTFFFYFGDKFILVCCLCYRKDEDEFVLKNEI